MRTAILIPCYNEAATIGKVVRDFKREIPTAEIYVYDNNSSDNTDKIAKDAGAIVRYEPMQGKGNVVNSMFREIDADVYLMVDGDDTYDASTAKQMIDMIVKDEYDMVIGDRLSGSYFKENKRLFHGFGNVLVRGMVNILFRAQISDVLTGYRAFNRSFVKELPNLSSGFQIETEMTLFALKERKKVGTVPCIYRDRPQESTSKLNTYKDGACIVWTILKSKVLSCRKSNFLV